MFLSLFLSAILAGSAPAAAENFQCQNETDAVTGTVESTRSPNVFTVTVRALNGASQAFSANPGSGYDFEAQEETSGYYDVSQAGSYLAFETRTRRDGSKYKRLGIRSAALFGNTDLRTMPCL
jgi:hypothetical protein